MSVQAVLQEAVHAALASHAGLDGVAVFDLVPLRSALPHAIVGEAVLADWGTKDMAGREGRLSVTVRDGGERPMRLRLLAGAAEAAVAEMPRAIGEGWSITSLVLMRARIARDGSGHWAASSEWRVRMLNTGS